MGMIPLTDKGKSLAWALGLGIAIGISAGWTLWKPRAPIVESPAVSIRQPDSSLVLARRPDTVVKIRHQLPPGFVPERHVELAVQPRPPIAPVSPNAGNVSPSAPIVSHFDPIVPAPVRIRLTLGRMPDGTRRVIASSPDGEVMDSLSIDVPLGESAAPARKLVHSIGVTRDVLTGAWGAVVTRDVAFLRLSAIGEPAQAGMRAQLKVAAGIRF